MDTWERDKENWLYINMDDENNSLLRVKTFNINDSLPLINAQFQKQTTYRFVLWE